MSDHLSIRDLEVLTKLPRWRINHAVANHGPEAADRIGTFRLWRRDQLPEILKSLAKTGNQVTVNVEATDGE